MTTLTRTIREMRGGLDAMDLEPARLATPQRMASSNWAEIQRRAWLKVGAALRENLAALQSEGEARRRLTL